VKPIGNWKGITEDDLNCGSKQNEEIVFGSRGGRTAADTRAIFIAVVIHWDLVRSNESRARGERNDE